MSTRELVTQGCCAVGGAIGLWFGCLAALGRTSGSAPAFVEVMLPVTSRVALGVLAGACVAWVMCIAAPRLLSTRARRP
jgi:hypothetical protein